MDFLGNREGQSRDEEVRPSDEASVEGAHPHRSVPLPEDLDDEDSGCERGTADPTCILKEAHPAFRADDEREKSSPVTAEVRFEMMISPARSAPLDDDHEGEMPEEDDEESVLEDMPGDLEPPSPQEDSEPMVAPLIETKRIIDLDREKKTREALREMLEELSEAELPDLAELPSTYDEDKLVILLRDPHKAFAYWDFSTKRKNEILTRDVDAAPEGQLYLKIYKATSMDELVGDPQLHAEIPIMGETRSCYFTLDENFDYYSGTIEFVPFFEEPVAITSSNTVAPPKASISGEFDEDWKAIEKIYMRFYQLVKKELETGEELPDIISDEEIAEIEGFEEVKELRELQRIARKAEDEPGERREKGGERQERPMGERGARETEDHREQVINEGERGEHPDLPPLTMKGKMQRRQELLRRLISAYLEKRKLPGGMYAPIIGSQHHSDIHEEPLP
jgi:hypothetical protein